MSYMNELTVPSSVRYRPARNDVPPASIPSALSPTIRKAEQPTPSASIVAAIWPACGGAREGRESSVSTAESSGRHGDTRDDPAVRAVSVWRAWTAYPLVSKRVR